jgi:hypothetical protein
MPELGGTVRRYVIRCIAILIPILVAGLILAADPPKKADAKVPIRVDNSESKYFPTIIEQKGNSCAQVAAVHYVFAYEMNRLRDAAGASPKNQYPDHFTWNCLSNGLWTGCSAIDGWAIIREMGIPSVEAYGEPFHLHLRAGWPSGYDIYYQAMRNRIERWGALPVRTPEDLEVVKGYLRNHGDPKQKSGGILLFGLQSQLRKNVIIPKGQHEAGKTLVTGWGIDGQHSMAIVGYDDEVGFDVNGDGKITNDVDLDGDGKITLADWERGAFIAVDPLGPFTADHGKSYVLYRLCALSPKQGGGGGTVWWVEPKQHEPSLTLRIKFKFDDRAALRFSVGIAGDPEADKPARSYQPGILNGRYKVGEVPMRGRDERDAIEMGLDLSDIASGLKDSKTGKFILNLSRKNGSRAKGEVLEAAILFYEKGKLAQTLPFVIKDGKFGEKPLELTVMRKP